MNFSPPPDQFLSKNLFRTPLMMMMMMMSTVSVIPEMFFGFKDNCYNIGIIQLGL